MAPATRRMDDRDDDRGFNWGPLIFLALLFCVGCPSTMVAGAYAYRTINGGGVAPSPAPLPNPVTQLDQAIRSAGVTKEHAVYFSKVCAGAAAAIEIDGKTAVPTISQRSEAATAIGNVGKLATAGTDARNYPGLPAVIVSAFKDVFPTDPDGKTKGGALSPEDRAEYVNRWRLLSEAFKRVSA